MHCFLPFEIYRPYAVYSNASCLLCSLFHGQWILGGPPLLLGLVVFIYKQQRAGPCSSACWLACLRFLSPPPPFYLLSNDLIILERKSQMWGLALPHICSCSINKFRYSSLRGPSQALLF